MALQLHGVILEVKNDSGEYQGRQWRSRTARVLSGKSDVLSVRLADEITQPAEGQRVVYAVDTQLVGDGDRKRIRYNATADLTPATPAKS